MATSTRQSLQLAHVAPRSHASVGNRCPFPVLPGWFCPDDVDSERTQFERLLRPREGWSSYHRRYVASIRATRHVLTDCRICSRVLRYINHTTILAVRTPTFNPRAMDANLRDITLLPLLESHREAIEFLPIRNRSNHPPMSRTRTGWALQTISLV